MNRVFAIIAASVGSAFFASPCLRAEEAAVPAADAGYFLDWSQRGDLLWTGTMQDSQGNIYNVKVCPGYVPMATLAGRYWRCSGMTFCEYAQKKTYADLYRASKEVVKWSSRDCLWDWGVKGAGKAWGKHFSRASQSVNRRAFGWIFAYPYALGAATVESAFRVVTGVPVGLCGDAIGVAVVPAVGGCWPTMKGVVEAAVPGTGLPALGTAWNSVGTPLLALTGQRPAPSRIDGFFVTMTPKKSKHQAPPILTPEEAAQLVRAAAELTPVVADITARRNEARSDSLAKLEALEKEMAARREAVKKTMEAQDAEFLREREARVQALLAAKPQLRDTLARLFKEGRLQTTRLDWSRLTPALQGTGLSQADLVRVCDLLAAPAAGGAAKWDATRSPAPFWLPAAGSAAPVPAK